MIQYVVKYIPCQKVAKWFIFDTISTAYFWLQIIESKVLFIKLIYRVVYLKCYDNKLLNDATDIGDLILICDRT